MWSRDLKYFSSRSTNTDHLLLRQLGHGLRAIAFDVNADGNNGLGMIVLYLYSEFIGYK